MKLARISAVALVWLSACALATADEFRHVGDYLLQSRVKLTGTHALAMPIKPLLLHAFTDGVEVRITAEGDDDARSIFEIYRSDGIGRPARAGGAVEIIPGVQAISRQGGQFRHLRLSRETLTITAFPGISDQTIITHAVAAKPAADAPTSIDPGTAPAAP